MSRLVAQYSGPPADRMAGRGAARAARAAAAKPKGNYTPKATTSRVDVSLSGERVLDQAILQGVIGSNMRSHYQTLWQADPTGTKEYLEKLGLYPDDTLEANAPEKIAASSEEYPTSALSRAELRRIAAAREGRPSRIVHGGL